MSPRLLGGRFAIGPLSLFPNKYPLAFWGDKFPTTPLSLWERVRVRAQPLSSTLPGPPSPEFCRRPKREHDDKLPVWLVQYNQITSGTCSECLPISLPSHVGGSSPAERRNSGGKIFDRTRGGIGQ